MFALAALSGIGRSFEVPATQGLITDIVPREITLQAIALHGTAMRTMTAIGGLVGGFAIHTIGAPTVLFAGAGALTTGAAIIRTLPTTRSRQPREKPTGLAMLPEALRELRWLISRPVVGGLLWAAFIVEMFGFTFNALMPSFARNVQAGRADGLGSVLGVATLAAASEFPRKGLLFIGITIAYGVFLVAFASSDFFLLSLTLLIGLGAAASMFDTIQMTLLQQHVPNDAPGRAIGGWVFTINFAWIGQMTLGYIAESVGVEFALAGAGGLVVVTGLAIFFLSPRLRQV